MLSLNGSRRRHAKQTSLSKKSDPPPALLLSARSSTSCKSSDTQATPRSIFHSSLRPSRRPTRDLRTVVSPELMEPQEAKNPFHDNENVDVFAFMERDDDSWNAPTAEQESHEHGSCDEEEGRDSPRILISEGVEASQMSPRYSDLEVRAIQDSVQRPWGRASLHSDSGISVHSGSPDQDSPKMPHKYPMTQEAVHDALNASLEIDDEPPIAELRDSPDFSASQGMFRHQHWSSSESRTSHNILQARHGSPQSIPHDDSFAPHLDMPEMPSRPVRELGHRRRSRPEKYRTPPTLECKAGYDALASTIRSQPQAYDSDSDAVLRPIYRKFEILNNRMLLYLQDEISEIEEQLQELDAAIAHEEVEMGRGPASRRTEAKLPNQLQWHRMELLGRSFAKIEQYNKALTSYAKLIRTVSPAHSTDIAAYKSWIAAHTPIDRSETAFLDKEDDLLTVTAAPKPSSVLVPQPQMQTTALDSPIMVLAFAFVATIIVFKFVPRILARLVISAVVGGAVLCLLRPEGRRKGLKGLGEWRRGIGLYSAVMLVLATVVS